MMMKKTAISLFLVLCICCISVISIAEVDPVKWNDAKDHNRWTEWMLFGNPSYSSYKTPEIKLRVEQLLDALLICIDQFNGHYKDKLGKLSFIDGVPDDLAEIDFTAGNFNKEENGHRVYTHLGWNHNYNGEKGHPEVRKQILTSVIEYVFQMKKHFPSDKADKVRDAMGCLLYCMHIIEDRYHSTSYHGARSTLLLADASSQTETVIHDLVESIQTIFPEVKRSDSLITSLQRMSNEIVAERRKDPTVDGQITVDRIYAAKLKDLLAEHLPGLFQKQPWFTGAFPLNWNSN
ncbi:MAG: hypothetical protein J6A79_00575 [Clostridia bacterium]|nr:hypothetical protein [Clostridia bacterium]